VCGVLTTAVVELRGRTVPSSGVVTAVHVGVCVAQIEEATVEFNAKINSVTKSETSTTTTASREVSGSVNAWIVKVNFKSSFSSTTQSKNSNVETREYSMRIFVKARQAPIPEGLKKILDILQEAIKDRVSASPSE
jgi:hypothetical protein